MMADNIERYRGRCISYFDTAEQAINSTSDDPESHFVFIHAGTYSQEHLALDSNFVMIGAGIFASYFFIVICLFLIFF